MTTDQTPLPDDLPDQPTDATSDATDDQPDDPTTDPLAAKVFRLAGALARHERRGHGPGFARHRGRGRVLALLALREQWSQKDLAYLLGVRPQSLGEQLAKLERDGLARRTQDASDRRTWTVELTEQGRTAAASAAAPTQDDPFDALDDVERARLAELLDKAIAALRGEDGDIPPFGPFGPGDGFPPFGPGGHGPRRGRFDPDDPESFRGGRGRRGRGDRPGDGRDDSGTDPVWLHRAQGAADQWGLADDWYDGHEHHGHGHGHHEHDHFGSCDVPDLRFLRAIPDPRTLRALRRAWRAAAAQRADLRGWAF